MNPTALLGSSKYSLGLTRTSAPVGQFSSHEKALLLAPTGLSGVSLHRLHLIASRSSVSVTAAGNTGGARVNQFLTRGREVCTGGACRLRGTIVIALYGHWVAQSPQPMQVFGSMSICPPGKRPMAPVGQPVRHSGSWQCRQTWGDSTC